MKKAILYHLGNVSALMNIFKVLNLWLEQALICVKRWPWKSVNASMRCDMLKNLPAFVLHKEHSSYMVYVNRRCSPTHAWCDVWQISPSPARLTVNVHLAASHGYLLFSASQGFSVSEQSASACLKEFESRTRTACRCYAGLPNCGEALAFQLHNEVAVSQKCLAMKHQVQ